MLLSIRYSSRSVDLFSKPFRFQSSSWFGVVEAGSCDFGGLCFSLF